MPARRNPSSAVVSPRKEEDTAGRNSLEPMKVYSEKDLVREFESLLKDLRNKEHDAWLKRNAALRTIQIKDCRDSLADALGDLRSVLVKEACTTVSMLAEVLGNSLAPLADVLLPVLLKQLPVTILVISEASHQCLRSFFKHVHSARMIPRIVEGCKAKQNAVRSKSAEYLLLILQCWSIADLEKQVEAVEVAIQVCLSDSQSEVRANARQCVLMFCERFEERGKRMMSGLDPSTQKKIMQEGASEADRRDALLSANKGATLNNPVVHVGDDRTSRPKSFSARESAGTGEKLPLGVKRISLTAGNPLDTVVTNCEDAGCSQPAASLAKGAKRVKCPVSPSAIHAPLQQSNQVNIPPSTDSSKSMGPPKRAPADRKPTQLKVDDQAGCSMDEATTVRISSKRAVRTFPSDEEVDVSVILDKANNALWSLRETALDELRSVIESGAGSKSAIQLLNRIAELVGDRMSDAHYRVQLAALGLVASLAQQFTASFAPHAEHLIARVFQRLTDKKEGVNKSAREVLVVLTDTYGLDCLVPSMIKTLESSQPLVRSTVLEYIIASFPVYLPFLQANSCHTRILCTRLWHLSVDKGLEVRRYSSSILLLLRSNGMAMLVYDSASRLPSDTQTLIRKAMVPHIAEFDKELNTYIRTRKLPADLTQLPTTINPMSAPAAALSSEIFESKQEPCSAWGETEVAPRDNEYSEWLDEFSRPCAAMKKGSVHFNPSESNASTIRDTIQDSPTASQIASVDNGGYLKNKDTSGDKSLNVVSGNLQMSSEGACVESQGVRKPANARPSALQNKDGCAGKPHTTIVQTMGEQMSQLVREVLSPDAGPCRSALETLSALAKKGDEATWKDWIGEVSIACVETLRLPVESGCAGHEAAMACMCALGVGLPGLVAPLVPLLVDALLTTAHYGRRSLLATAEDTASSLLLGSNPGLAIDVIETTVKQADAPVLQSTLRVATRVVKGLPHELVSHHAQRLVAPILPHINHPDADVRKSVVFTLVAFYQVVGEELRQYLQSLTASQHKLIAIYLQRSAVQSPASYN